jgi:chaperonin GroES
MPDTDTQTDLIRPLFDNIIVKEVDPPEIRKSGLLVPDNSREQHPPQEGIVIAAGPGLDWWGTQGIEMPVKRGDKVVFPWQVGTYIEVEEEKLLVMRVVLLLAVLP